MIRSLIGLRVPGSKPVHDVIVRSSGGGLIPMNARHNGKYRSKNFMIIGDSLRVPLKTKRAQ
jgi:hypothetical protein